MTDERIKELANKWNLFPTDNAWDEVMGFSYDLLAEKRKWVGLTGDETRQIVLDDPFDWVAAVEAKLKEKNA